MENEIITIDGDKIVLEEVAVNGNSKLYRYNADDRICGAPLHEIKKRFPDYNFTTFEPALYDFLLKVDGKFILYDPDGSIIDD